VRCTGIITSMQQTSLYDTHRSLGAKMISFGGWDMPRDYGLGTVSEVKACRAGVGLFDVSHMGEFRVTGDEALDFVQHITTNDASRLVANKAQYSLLLNENGGVIDDVIVYCASPNNYCVVVNAGCKIKDWDWFILQARAYNVELIDESDITALIAAQGPNARAMVQGFADTDLTSLKRFQAAQCSAVGVKCTVSRTGYTGEDGFELFCAWDDAPEIWSALVEAGAVPCGLAARDVLRIEAAYPLYGHELKDTESPLGLGLGWAIKTTKLDFIGRHTIVSGLQDGLRRQLVGIKMIAQNAIPRENQMIFVDAIDDPIGFVTSGTLSPMLGCGIALGRIGAGFAEVGTEVLVDIRGRRTPALIAALPFYRGLDL
jgi:aminomethyltransferase